MSKYILSKGIQENGMLRVQYQCEDCGNIYVEYYDYWEWEEEKQMQKDKDYPYLCPICTNFKYNDYFTEMEIK